MMARALGDALEKSLGFMGEYDGLGEDKGGKVEVNTDFGVAALRGDLPGIVSAFTAGLLSKKTAWSEMQRRNFLSESFDADTELELLASEAPVLDGENLLADGTPNPKPAPPPPKPGAVK